MSALVATAMCIGFIGMSISFSMDPYVIKRKKIAGESGIVLNLSGVLGGTIFM